MFRRTSHCVCPPNSTFKINPLNTDKFFQINALSNDFLMHSPPLPPRTIKNSFPTKYPSNKNTISNDWNDKVNSYNSDKRIQCSCARPHSCPAEESSFILTPPIPPKTCSLANSQSKSKTIKTNTTDEQLKKFETSQNDNRKSSRYRGTEKPNSRKKSRSNSRSIVRDCDKSKLLLVEKLPAFNQDAVEHHVNKYLLKNNDNLVEKNCQKSQQHKQNELCKICGENNNATTTMKYPMRQFIDMSNSPLLNQAPDLVTDRTNSMAISAQSATTTTSQQQPQKTTNKFRNKLKSKLTQFWSKSKKSVDNSSTSPINRDSVITPENSHVLKYRGGGGDDDDDNEPHDHNNTASRPRRSKSLHLIPDSSLSPKTSMQTKSSVHHHNTSTDASITKNSSIFAVISPSTARWKRNLFCISPKAGGSRNSKKSDCAMSMGNTGNSSNINNNSNNNNNNINNNNSNSNNQQRNNNPPSSISAGRISPVHLLAKPSNNSNAIIQPIESTRREKEQIINSINTHNSGKNQKFPANRIEKSDVLNSKLASGSKTRNRIHQENLNKSLPSSSMNQPLNLSNSPNQMCHCHNYHINDNHLSCNNAYSRVCSQFPRVHNNPSCQIYNIDSNTNLDMTPGCSQVCGCVRNIVHFSQNHFHYCHPHNANAVLCSSCRIPIFCTSCSYNCYNSKPCHHSTSPPPFLSRQLPPPPPPPPANAFSSGHHFPRKSRQSYSKTPPPSFHTHQHSCHDDHCYQEYNLNFNHENCQKLAANKSRTYNFNNTNPGCCCCQKLHNHCYMTPHSKCSGCGSFIYDELSTLSTHYNMSGFHKNQFSNTPAADSLLEIKWRNTEQGLINQCRLFTSSVNNEESASRFCHHNHCSNRPSGTCGHFSNEMKTPCYRNRDKLLKRRKSSSHSCHGSNLDPEADEKCTQHEISRTHFGSPTNNIFTANSAHISPDLNTTIPNSDQIAVNGNINNNLNMNSSVNMTSSVVTSIQMTNLVDSNDKFEPWRKTFKENMLALRNLGWYWGPLNHLEAENLVENRPDGTFLVRDSAHDTYFLSLTFRVLGTTYHTRIEYSQGKFSFWSQPESHSATTIVEFIDKAVAHSASGKFHYFLQTSTPGQPPMEVSLLYPLSRYQIIQSLQHLSRFVILSNIRKDHVSQLQLPSSLKSYLLEKQYYIDNIDSFVKLTKDAEPLIYEPSRNLVNNIHSTNNL